MTVILNPPIEENVYVTPATWRSCDSLEILESLRKTVAELQTLRTGEPRCYRCGYVGAHDPYCLENPANADLREWINQRLLKWLNGEDNDDRRVPLLRRTVDD